MLVLIQHRDPAAKKITDIFNNHHPDNNNNDHLSI